MTSRQTFRSDTPWEGQVGYSRAIKVGQRIYVSGTTATDAEGNLIGEGNAYAQARQCICNISAALEALGASLQHVVRTRMFVVDITQWPEFGRAHAEFFQKICPCTSMVEVRALIDPRILIEIEAEAEL